MVIKTVWGTVSESFNSDMKKGLDKKNISCRFQVSYLKRELIK